MNTNAATGSGRVIQAHQAIAEDIKALGVDTVFGLMSDDTAVFCTALDGLGIAFHGARHRTTPSRWKAMLCTRRLGVAIVAAGPPAPTACTPRSPPAAWARSC